MPYSLNQEGFSPVSVLTDSLMLLYGHLYFHEAVDTNTQWEK